MDGRVRPRAGFLIRSPRRDVLRPSLPSECPRDHDAGPDGPEGPECVQACAAEELGPLVLPVPTWRESVAALGSAPDGSVVGVAGAAREALPGEGAAWCDVLCSVGVFWPSCHVVWTFAWTCWGCSAPCARAGVRDGSRILPSLIDAGPAAESGRGMALVHHLTGGHWGHPGALRQDRPRRPARPFDSSRLTSAARVPGRLRVPAPGRAPRLLPSSFRPRRGSCAVQACVLFG